MPDEIDSKYTVGFRKPPAHGRFRKGFSGNPGGRPKGRLNAATVLARALAERVVVNDRGVRKKVTKLQALMMQILNKALAGDVRATTFITNLYNSVPPERSAEISATELPAADQKILERMLNRMQSDKENDNG